MKSYKYMLLTISALAIMLLSIIWDSGKDKSLEVTGSPKKRIVIISHIYDNEYWKIIKEGAEVAAKQRGAMLEYAGPETSSLEESIRLIEKYTVAKKDGIITYVLEADSATVAINEAADKKIPVITIDTDAKDSKRYAYVGTDNVRAGEKAAKLLVEKLGRKAKVAVIMGGDKNTNQKERVQGFTEYLKRFPSIKIVDIKSSNSYPLEAELETKKILENTPDIDWIFCTSALDGMGAARAVKELNMTEKVKIVSFDDLPETLELIKQGEIYATIAQKPYDMGYMAVNIMMDILEGRELDRHLFITDTEIITKENIDLKIKELQ